MPTRYFALVYGIVFLLVGIAGFIPALLTGPDIAAPDVPGVTEAPEPPAAPEAPDTAQAPEPEAPAPEVPEAPAPDDQAADGMDAMAHDRLFGLFPVNALHNLVHVAFGIWGLVAFRAFFQARLYARTVAIIYAVLAVAGLIPGLNTLWGLVPLYGHDIWLHAVLAIIAAYFGWVQKPGPDTVTATTATPR